MAGMVAALVLVLASLTIGAIPGALDVVHPAMAQQEGRVPGAALGNTSDSDFWRAIRQGGQGMVSIPNEQAGVLIQSEGENWRAIRNGPLSTYGVWAMLGMIALLALFFALRGRVRIEHGRSGRVIERFNGVERFAHWLTAVSFVVLALTGLNILYGRYVLLPILGPEIFSALTLGGKYAHNFLAFAFMAGLVLIFLFWVRDNIPNLSDAKWIAKGGGILTKGTHPPAKRFNAGQKIVFWLVILGGLSISLSGIALLFPFEFSMFSKTFAFLNLFGFDLPTNLAPIQEMQLSQVWHATVGLLLVVVIIAHIYIGTIGMEGAFDAMGTGMVDENWAREHHDLWVEEQERQARTAPSSAAPVPGGE
jgi:formate dehydrogenase subunit gamma